MKLLSRAISTMHRVTVARMSSTRGRFLGEATRGQPDGEKPSLRIARRRRSFLLFDLLTNYNKIVRSYGLPEEPTIP